MNMRLNGPMLITLATVLRNIETKCGTDFDTLNQSLPAIFEDQTQIMSSEEFTPKRWRMILKMFGEFSEEIHKLSEHLARFEVDKEEGTVIIYGNDLIGIG